MAQITTHAEAQFIDTDRADDVHIADGGELLNDAGIEHYVGNADSLTELASCFVGQTATHELLELNDGAYYTLQSRFLAEMTPHVEEAWNRNTPIESETYVMFADRGAAIAALCDWVKMNTAE